MNRPDDLSARPMAEPRPAPQGSSVGGMSSSADAGLGDATQRSMERGDEVPAATASTAATPAAASTGPASAASTAAPSAPGRSDHNADWDKGEPARHAPVAPKDEGVLESLGRSISEGLTGADSSTTPKPSDRG